MSESEALFWTLVICAGVVLATHWLWILSGRP